MAKHGVRFKLEQIVSLLRQIEVLTANGKTLDEAGRQKLFNAPASLNLLKKLPKIAIFDLNHFSFLSLQNWLRSLEQFSPIYKWILYWG